MFWLSVSEVSSKGLTFLGTMYLARKLGRSGFGLFSLALAAGNYLWIVVDLGIIRYGTREIARDKNKAAELYSTLVSMRLILALFLFLLFSGAIYLTNMAPALKLCMMTGGFYVVACSLSPDWVFRGLEKMQYIAFGNIATSLLFLAAIFILVKKSSAAFLASASYAGSFLLGSLILVVLLYRKLGIPFTFKISFRSWLFHAKESFYFAMNNAISSLSLYIPIFFMGIWNTTEDVGTFAAPYRLTTFISNASLMSITALYPVLANLYVTDLKSFKSTHSKFQRMIIWISLPVCIIVTTFSREIVVLLFGASYANSTSIFNILAWLSFLSLIKASYGNAIISAGFHRFNMLATGAGAIVVVLVSLALIPSNSGYGAAWALILGEVVTLVLMAWLFRQKVYRSEFPKNYLIKVVFAGIVMVLLMRSLHLTMILGTLIGFIFYGTLSLGIGIISRNQIQRALRHLMAWRTS